MNEKLEIIHDYSPRSPDADNGEAYFSPVNYTVDEDYDLPFDPFIYDHTTAIHKFENVNVNNYKL